MLCLKPQTEKTDDGSTNRTSLSVVGADLTSMFPFSISVLLTWSSLSNPGALPYPPSPAHGDRGSAPPLTSSHKDRTLPSSPCSAIHDDPADGEKGSEIDPDPGPTLCPLGLEEASWAGRGSGGLGGGGELGVGNDGSSDTKGSEEV